MAYAKIRLPFNLPCNLLVTQIAGSSPSHRTGNAIDVAPIIHPEDPYGITRYIGAYMKLVAHMKRGDLRINSSRSCWHYHYYLRSRDAWEFGYEHYCKSTSGTCVKCGDIQQYKLTGAAASINFLNMLRMVRSEISGDGSYAWNPVFSAIRDTWDQFFIQDLPETSIEYNTSRFSLDDVEKFVSNFSSEIVWAPVNTTYLMSPGESEDKRDGIITIAGLAAALYLYVAGSKKN